MGQAFSVEFPDTSKDVISAADAFTELVLAVCWAGSFYAMGMIFTSLQLIDRWRGPRDDYSVGLSSVLAALLLSIAWPIVLVVLALNNNS